MNLHYSENQNYNSFNLKRYEQNQKLNSKIKQAIKNQNKSLSFHLKQITIYFLILYLYILLYKLTTRIIEFSYLKYNILEFCEPN